MKRIYRGGPMDGLTDEVADAPRGSSEDAITRGVIGTVFPIASPYLICGKKQMRSLYRVSQVQFSNGVLNAVLLEHIGYDSQGVLS